MTTENTDAGTTTEIIGTTTEKCIVNKDILKCKTTNESGSKIKNTTCLFPFKLDDKTFNSCTDEEDPDGRFWCSTKLDESGKHIQGNWGYCSEDCFSSATEEPEKPTCLTTDESASAVKNAPCVFPWKRGNQTYDSCTTDEDPDGRHWCTTKLDESGTYVEGSWGYCSDDCFECRTTNQYDSREKNVPCHFPFILFGKVYEKCTTAKDPDGKFWCSTEVDESGQHVRKKWGYCSNKCDLSEIQTNTRYL